jgi:hypothetical protein
LLKNADARLVAKINATSALQSMYDESVQKAFIAALSDGDELKRVVAEALGQCAKKGDSTVQDALLKAVSEEDHSVRRAVFLAMARLDGPGAADSLSTSLSFDDGKDVVLRDGILRALERLGKGGMTALMSLADSGVQQDTDRVVESFLATRSRAAFDTVPFAVQAQARPLRATRQPDSLLCELSTRSAHLGRADRRRCRGAEEGNNGCETGAPGVAGNSGHPQGEEVGRVVKIVADG